MEDLQPSAGVNARMSRRELLRRSAGLALGTVSLGLLAACGEREATPAPSSNTGSSGQASPQAGSTPSARSSGSAGELVIYNWYQPWIKEVYPIFEQETGIKVTQLGTYSSNDEWWAKLSAGESFDFFIPSTRYVTRAMAADMITPLDLSLIPNYQNLLKDFQRLPYYEKDDKPHAVPFTRVYYALAYNTEEFPQAPDSWAVTWDKTYAGRIALHDQAFARVAITAMYLGDDPINPTRWDDIRQALIEQKPLVKKYWKDYQNGMELFVNKEVVVGQLTDGRVRMGQDLGAPIAWTVPKEGCLIFIDTFAIPKTAKNVENAHKFINFLLREDIMLKELQLMRYDAVNEAARKKLSPEELARFNAPEGAKLVVGDTVSTEVLNRCDELWNEVKLA